MIFALLLAVPLDGVALPYYPREPQSAPPDLAEVRGLGAAAILVPNPFVIPTPTASTIAPGPETRSPAQVLALARAARAQGLAWVSLPFLVVAEGDPGDWRGNLRPIDRDAFWRAYEQHLTQEAELAARGGAAALVIGSELTSLSTPGTEARWQAIAAAARTRYPGRLVYASNHDALDHTAPYGAVDVIGVSAYFPLTTDPDADADTLAAVWAERAQDLVKLGRRQRRPVWIVELGYGSVDGAAIRPWDHGSGGVLDLEEQAAAYSAATHTLAQTPEIGAVFFWHWHGRGGLLDRSYTPRGKPAELLLRHFFWARAR